VDGCCCCITIRNKIYYSYFIFNGNAPKVHCHWTSIVGTHYSWVPIFVYLFYSHYRYTYRIYMTLSTIQFYLLYTYLLLFIIILRCFLFTDDIIINNINNMYHIILYTDYCDWFLSDVLDRDYQWYVSKVLSNLTSIERMSFNYILLIARWVIYKVESESLLNEVIGIGLYANLWKLLLIALYSRK